MGLLCSSCSSEQQPLTAFDVTGADGRGIDPTDRAIIISDAKQRIPPILKSCGLGAFREVPTSDYIFTYWFELSRARLPKGAYVERSQIPAGAL
jgi:hypothetical protein